MVGLRQTDSVLHSDSDLFQRYLQSIGGITTLLGTGKLCDARHRQDTDTDKTQTRHRHRQDSVVFGTGRKEYCASCPKAAVLHRALGKQYSK